MTEPMISKKIVIITKEQLNELMEASYYKGVTYKNTPYNFNEIVKQCEIY